MTAPRKPSPLADAAALAAQVWTARRLARRNVRWGLDAEAAANRAAYNTLLVCATGVGVIFFCIIALPATLAVLMDPGHGGFIFLPAKLVLLAWDWLAFGGWLIGAWHFVYRRPGTGPLPVRILATPWVFLTLFVASLPVHIVLVVLLSAVMP